MSKSLLEMVKGRLREFRREPSAFFFVLFMPILWMVILGGAFSRTSQPQAHIGWIPTEGEFATHIREALEKDPHFIVKQGDLSTQRHLLGTGAVDLYIDVEENQVRYHFDAQHPEALHTRRWVDESLQSAMGRISPVLTEDRRESIPGSRYIDFLIPGLLAFSLFTTSLFGTGMTIVSHRRDNLLKRFLTTPIRPSEYILSHLIGRLLIMMLEIAIILSTGNLLFGFQIQGSFLAFLFLCVVGTSAFASMAIAIGSRMNETGTYNSITNLLMLPMMLLGGIWFSLSHFPEWTQPLLGLLPLTALVNGFRRIALEGGGLLDVLPQSAILLVVGLFCFAWSRKRFLW